MGKIWEIASESPRVAPAISEAGKKKTEATDRMQLDGVQ